MKPITFSCIGGCFREVPGLMSYSWDSAEQASRIHDAFDQ